MTFPKMTIEQLKELTIELSTTEQKLVKGGEAIVEQDILVG